MEGGTWPTVSFSAVVGMNQGPKKVISCPHMSHSGRTRPGAYPESPAGRLPCMGRAPLSCTTCKGASNERVEDLPGRYCIRIGDPAGHLRGDGAVGSIRPRP